MYHCISLGINPRVTLHHAFRLYRVTETTTLKVSEGSGWGGFGGREGCQWQIQRGARDTAPPPLGPNSFVFMQFSVKVLQNNRLARHSQELASFLGNPSSVPGCGSNIIKWPIFDKTA